jgi:hypothetical protein
MWQSEDRGQLPQAGALGLRLAACTRNVLCLQGQQHDECACVCRQWLRLVLL